MIKAEDTVMDIFQLDDIARQLEKDYPAGALEKKGHVYLEGREIQTRTAHAQAEITWKAREPEIAEAHKAGKEEESTQAYHTGLHDGLYDGILRGRKEVVEWLKKYTGAGFVGYVSGDEKRIDIPKKEWQAKLKGWGIE